MYVWRPLGVFVQNREGVVQHIGRTKPRRAAAAVEEMVQHIGRYDAVNVIY